MVDALDKSCVSARSDLSAVQRNSQVLKIVNTIFAANNLPKVNKLAQDFSDGALFLRLFNVLFDENVRINLVTNGTVDDKVQNWNKINVVICFNHLQQQFILIGSTMQALANGKKDAAAKVILCLLEATLGTQFEAYLDSDILRDIANMVSFEVNFNDQDKEDLQT